MNRFLFWTLLIGFHALVIQKFVWDSRFGIKLNLISLASSHLYKMQDTPTDDFPKIQAIRDRFAYFQSHRKLTLAHVDVVEDLLVPYPERNQPSGTILPWNNATEGIKVRLYYPNARQDEPRGLIVFFHGGGWVMMNVDLYDSLTRQIAAETGLVVASVDYRLAPESKFPIPVDDALHATRSLLTHINTHGGITIQGRSRRIDASKLVLMGDSAGGNFAAVVAQDLAKLGTPVAMQALIYPSLGLGLTTDSWAQNARSPILPMELTLWFRRCYLPEPRYLNQIHERFAPIMSPDSVVSRVAPAFMLAGTFDGLHDDAHAYASRLRRLNVPVSVVDFDAPHGFLSLDDDVAKEAVRQLCQAVSERVQSSPHR